jgi:NAD(P)-dependent dehydrogenase (short-subunit alcohol dehydrogenase family)
MTTSNASSAGQRPCALVTGCSSGFGLLTALELAHAGLRVVATMRNPDGRARLDEAARLEGVESSIEVRQLDVTRPDSIARCVGEVGAVDVLVNNAGYGLGGFLEDVSMEELREQFETNFFGVVQMIRTVLPGMRERRSGRIINVTSISGRVALPGVSAYNSSKFAVEGLSESLRYELLPFNIFVSLVEPGTFRTDIFDRNRRLAAGFSAASPYYQRAQHILRLSEERVSRSTEDPRQVARTIRHVAQSRRPVLRYLVGKGAHAQAWMQHLLPHRAFEAIVQRMTVPGPGGAPGLDPGSTADRTPAPEAAPAPLPQGGEAS